MEIEFTGHARRRMLERGITEEEIREALAKKRVVYPAGEGGKTWIRSEVGGREVKVLCLYWGAPRVKVITAAIRE